MFDILWKKTKLFNLCYIINKELESLTFLLSVFDDILIIYYFVLNNVLEFE